MRRLYRDEPPPPFTEAETRLLLLGPAAPVTMRQLLFRSRVLADPEIWPRHEPFLRGEAARLGIRRPADGFAAEKRAEDWRRRHANDDATA
jgi:hypothetical protein